MTEAKEKAKELIEKFDVKYYYHFTGGKFPVSMHDSVIKQCVLICVDEMIDYHNSLFNKGFKDIHIALSSPIKTYNDVLNPALIYLQEVKTEIEKL